MNLFETITPLNFRNEPLLLARTLKAVLPLGTQVEKVEDASVKPWWKIKVASLNNEEGFVHSKYLISSVGQESNSTKTTFSSEHKVNLTPGPYTKSRRDVAGGWAYPLNEAAMPKRDINATENEKILAIHDIIKFLDVEHSARYLPKSTATYCNVYAYDFCFLNEVYLPRVWWAPNAFSDILKGNFPEAKWNKTVREQSANALYDWLVDFGDDFGWNRIFSIDELQQEVNKGCVGVISAKNINPNHSGHITCVVPEDNSKGLRASRARDEVLLGPLQTQAGRNNRKYFNTTWWANPRKFKDFGFWMHP
ncbi:MAG: hypothetical protein HC819_19295 [Cyclobacteriaceae bacterium]|nr:hypothetical protein [Cyclobacteriaceae bacterium]